MRGLFVDAAAACNSTAFVHYHWFVCGKARCNLQKALATFFYTLFIPYEVHCLVGILSFFFRCNDLVTQGYY
jgi:hypothetical protein